MIDSSIRGLPENRTKYEYCDANGIYVPEYNVDFGETQMYIHVDKGSCLRQWVLLNVLYSIVGAATSFPYSLMLSAIVDLVVQEHPGAQKITGADIAKSFASNLLEVVSNTSTLSKIRRYAEIIDIAATAYFTYDEISNGTSCTNDCYNISITVISKEEIYDCHQIKYHFSDGVATMGRYSEYNIDGINTVLVSADYYDHVNDREYNVYTK